MIFLMTFTSYGAHLPGDERGSFDHVRAGQRRFVRPNPGLEVYRRKQMRQPPFELRDATSRRVVRDAIVKVCDFRSVPLYALHVRTNHVHGVVEAEDARRVLHDWKAYATRSLRDAGLVAPDRVVWTHGGNASPLRSSASVRAAIRYVLEGQGEGMETYCGG